MINKEACLVILDLSEDMYKNNMQYLKEAFQFISALLAQFLLYYKKNDQIGLLLINSDNGEEKNGLELFIDLQSARFTMLHSVKELYQRLQTQQIQGKGDIFKALKESNQLFQTHYKKKKYRKKIFLITSGNSESYFSDHDLKILALKYLKSEIKINLISESFWHRKESELNEMEIKFKNQVKHFQEFNNNIKVFDKTIALKIISDFQKAKISNVCIHRGNLQLAPSCNLDVQVFVKTSKKTFPSLKKFSKSHQNKINLQTSYINPEDTEMNEIDKQNLVKGYNYGQQIVPISKEMENTMKYKNEKSFMMLGFVEEGKIKREYLMSGVECVLPSANSSKENIKAFNSLVYSLIISEKVGIARFVKRNNSNPKLVVLYPHRKFNQAQDCHVYMFYISELPTVEDMREYSFGSILRCTSKQRKLIGEYIDKLDIKEFEDNGEEKELVNPKETFNPNLQVFYQTVIKKGLSEHPVAPIIEVDEKIEEVIYPEKKTFQKIEHLETRIKEMFDFRENEEEVKKDTKIYWSDLLKTKAENLEEAEIIEKLKNRDDEPVVRKISVNHPISDFKEMMNYRREDLVESAVRQMQGRIIEFIKNSVDGSFFEKAFECLRVLREGCVDEEEVEMYNGFLIRFKQKLLCKKNFSDFWKAFKNKDLSLVTKDEVEVSKVNKEQADKFKNDDDYIVITKDQEEVNKKVVNIAEELD